MPLTETLLVLSIQAEMGELPVGTQSLRAERSGLGVGVGGSLGAKVLHTVQFSAPLLCSLRSQPPTTLTPSSWLVFVHEKSCCHCGREWPPDPSQHGKVHPSAASYIKSATVMRKPPMLPPHLSLPSPRFDKTLPFVAGSDHS